MISAKHILIAACLAVAAAGCSPQQEASYELPAPEDVMMYQVNPRVFAPEASFNAVTQQLDSIRQIGANVVWFMPIYKVGELKSVNSPYCIQDYKALNPEFGTMDEFKNVVAECHRRGMSVIIDWVANHTSWDNAWIENRDWYTQDEDGEIISPEGTGWLDVADLNFDNAEMRLAMIDAMKFWVTEAGVDGFRCDAADFVPYDFWKQAIDSLRAMPDRRLLMLAEGMRKDHFDAGFEMNYAWAFMNSMRKVFIGGESAKLLFDTDIEEYDSIPEGCVKLRFTTNHDEASKLAPIVEYGGERGSMSAFVIATYLHGGALIYGSQEVGYPEPINFFHYVPVDWSANNSLRKEYEKLMALYNKYPAIRKGSIAAFPDDNVMIFEKSLDGERILVVANVRDSAVEASLPEGWNNIDAENMMTGDRESLGENVICPAYGYKIYRFL